VDSSPWILIAGARALGSVFGEKLRTFRCSVTLLGCRAHLEAATQKGLRIGGPLADLTVDGFELFDQPASLRGRFDLILFVVKSYDSASLAPLLRYRLAEGGLLVSLQNGLGHLEQLIRYFRRPACLAAA
jgi:2-dehydropantoate 2-reductase